MVFIMVARVFEGCCHFIFMLVFQVVARVLLSGFYSIPGSCKSVARWLLGGFSYLQWYSRWLPGDCYEIPHC